MGWTGYADLTTQEAITFELRGTSVHARTGNWVMWENENGHVGLTHFLTKRSGSTAFIKAVDITMGPLRTPPASVARKFVAAYGGDVDAAGGEYGAPILRQALAPKPRTPKPIPGYTVFTIPEDKYVSTWSDGVAFAGEYVWLGKYRARRMLDGRVVRLPRNWRRRWLTPAVAE